MDDAIVDFVYILLFVLALVLLTMVALDGDDD